MSASLNPQLTRRSFLAAGTAFCFPTLTLFAAATAAGTPKTQITSWQFYQGPLDPRFQIWHSEELVAWQEVAVPHCFNAHDACDPDTPAYRGPGWYRVKLPVHNPYADGRTILHFEGVGQSAEIYIGDQLAGAHSGGYDEFTVDITNLASAGTVQLAVLCDNGRDIDRMPSDLSDFTLYGGLYRPVHLVYLPAVSIRSLHTQVRWQPGEAARLSVHAQLYNPKSNTGTFSLEVEFFSPTGSSIVKHTLSSAAWQGERELFTYELAHPELWSPATPNLYRCDLSLTCRADVSCVSERFGVRHTRFEEHGPFFLNGTQLPIRGTHRHEDHAGYAAAVPDSIVREEMRLMKAMGANFVRLAHYQQSRLTLNLCDEMGLMVWEEAPWCRSGIGGELMQQRLRLQLTNMIEQHRNHPAIVLWGLGNEDDWPGEYQGDDHDAIRAYMTGLRDLAHSLDPTRLTSYRRCDFARDIPDVYSPSIWAGWYSGTYREYQGALEQARAAVPHFLHVEFGADSHAGRHAEDADPVLEKLTEGHGTAEVGLAYKPTGGASRASRDGEWTETYACELFDWYLKVQGELPWLSGAVQWVFKDFTTPLRVTNPVPRVNQKGVLTRDMETKEGYYVFQSYWAEKPMLRVYGHNWPVRWGSVGQERLVRIYSNCAEVELFLNGVSMGTKKRDPRDYPCAGLRWKARFKAGKNILLARALSNGRTLTDTVQFTYQTETWGEPAALRLVRLNDGRIEATMHDASSVLCLDANAFVRFGLSGAGQLRDNLGTPSGSRVVQLYNGRATIMVEQGGDVVASVESKGIAPVFLSLPYSAKSERDGGTLGRFGR